MFHRRFLLVTAAASALWLSACSLAIPTKVSVPKAELEANLAKTFPKRFPVAGLLQMNMQQPVLVFLPQTNQLQTTLHVDLNGIVLPQAINGQLQMRFGLAYNAQDHSVRAQNVQVQSLAFQGISAAMSDMVQTYGPRLAKQALEDFPLYTVPAKDLQRMNTFNLQPGAITVTSEGLDVAIEKKGSLPAQP